MKRHFFFWGLPSLFCLLMMAFYYSGNHFLIDLVTPRVSGLGEQYDVNGYRELGMLENAQHLLILFMAFILIRGLKSSDSQLQRTGFFFASAGVIFIFLEEVDYGVHYLEFLTGQQLVEGNFNLHNQGGNTSIIKSMADLFAVIWFLFLPLISLKVRHVWLNYLAAPPMVVLTVFCALLVSQLAHYFDDAGMAIRPSLSNNISEFREIFTYYLWLLYFWHITHTPWPGKNPEQTAEPVQ